MSIRPVADAASLRAVNALFADVFGDDDAYRGAPPRDGYLERLLANDAFIALGSWDGDTLVGALAAYVLPKFERERSECYLYDLAVASTHRRRGIATALIVELQRLAATRGARVVFVQADRGDDAAIALYSKLGTREDVYHFDLRPSG